MAIYRMEKDNKRGTSVEITSEDKTLFNRLELAIDHCFKQYKEEQKKKEKCK